MKFDKFLQKIKIATKIEKQAELAEALGIRQPTVSDAKKRNSAPAEWLMKLYESHNLDPLWLAYGIRQAYVSQEKCGSSEVAEKEPKYGSKNLDVDAPDRVSNSSLIFMIISDNM